mgnify:CR=1 FL=1
MFVGDLLVCCPPLKTRPILFPTLVTVALSPAFPTMPFVDITTLSPGWNTPGTLLSDADLSCCISDFSLVMLIFKLLTSSIISEIWSLLVMCGCC